MCDFYSLESKGIIRFLGFVYKTLQIPAKNRTTTESNHLSDPVAVGFPHPFPSPQHVNALALLPNQ